MDVNIYSSGGRGTEKIRGNVENTDVGKFLRGWLDLDNEVEDITKELVKKLGSKAPSQQQFEKIEKASTAFEADGLASGGFESGLYGHLL